jgi:hypothetical protein
VLACFAFRLFAAELSVTFHIASDIKFTINIIPVCNGISTPLFQAENGSLSFIEPPYGIL